MTDRPILFSAPMIRALLAGQKTMTRRILKLPKKTHGGGPIYERPDMGGWEATTLGGGGCFSIGPGGERIPEPERAAIWHRTTGTCMSAPCAVGDRLWVKERGWISPSKLAFLPFVGNEETRPEARVDPQGRPYKTCVSIHMPRWASRITLHVTAVKVERLSAISEEDAIAEGIEDASDGVPAWKCYLPEPKGQDAWACPRESFRTLWESINGPGSWATDPWVVAISFRPILANIDAPEVAAA